MIVRELKLKLTKKQENTFNEWLWILSGVYNFAIRKIKLDAKDSIYHSQFDFMNKCSAQSRFFRGGLAERPSARKKTMINIKNRIYFLTIEVWLH